MKIYALIISWVVVMITLTACSSENSLPTSKETQVIVEKTYVDLGDNIYYIPKNKMEFINLFKVFKKEHPELKIISIEGNGTGTYGYNTGFYIFCELK